MTVIPEYRPGASANHWSTGSFRLAFDLERMSKTLSNGVLSLRFMQNAQRAKQLKEVELQRAEVVDEGKWEVSQAVREAWGLTKERNEDL